ncbi:MAG: phage baseplate assembly protein V [Myxococcota bacterium]
MNDDSNLDGGGPRYFGVYPAIVTSLTKDDQKLGRIEVSFPFLGEAGKDVRALATLCSPYADDNQGFEVLPEEKSQVVVAFEAGDLRRPYIIGACWNGKEKLPVTPEQANNKRVLRTRSGSILEFDDTKGGVKVTLKTAGGHKLELKDTPATITLKHSGGPSIVLSATGITIDAQQTLLIKAASVTVQAPSTTHTGSITCTGLTATSVTSPLYSQGAGNIW